MMLRTIFSLFLACLPLLICGDVIKSAVAKKQIEIAENAPAFDNPYITDGLVAMYDGEWNTALGVHDDEAVIWNNVVNGINSMPLYNVTVNSLCMKFDGESSYAYLPGELGIAFPGITPYKVDVSYEVVFRSWYTNVTYSVMLDFSGDGKPNGTCITFGKAEKNVLSTNNRGYSRHTPWPFYGDQSWLHTFTHAYKNVYVDGNEVSTRQQNRFQPYPAYTIGC